MKYIILLYVCLLNLHASIDTIQSFEADFEQKIKDERGSELVYSGHIVATNPQYALWNYKTPLIKDILIRPQNIYIIEPELEQVIIKRIHNNFDFFSMIKNAKKIGTNKYFALFNNIEFTIYINENIIQSIEYLDEFENSVVLKFTNQKQNQHIALDIFNVTIPEEYDIIRD